MKWVILILVIYSHSFAWAQAKKDFSIAFSITQPDQPFELENLRFYITNVKLLQKNTNVYHEELSYHLVDLIHNKNSFSVSYPEEIQFDGIHFDLGVEYARWKI